MWIRIRVAELGIKPEQVFPPPEPVSAKKKEESRTLYRDAFGNTWDGTGEFPGWLQRYVNAGQSPDFYRVDA